MKFIPSGDPNLAYCIPSSTVHPCLSKHAETSEQGIYEILPVRTYPNFHPGFYSAVGYGLANSILIVGVDSCILVDCTESLTSAEQIREDFKRITSKPITTVIYTHHHLDHIGGVKAFVTKKQVRNGDVEIIAHETLLNDVRNLASLVGPINNARAAYTFGVALEHGPHGRVHDGIGPCIRKGITTFIPPTIVVSDEFSFHRSGVNFTCIHAPAETKDALVIWFPADHVILTGDQLMGECCPNICSIRGTPPRNPKTWYTSIDKVRKLNPHHMIPSHGRPVSGKNDVRNILTAYRDAIQYVHDQTVRHINKGYSPDELVQIVSELPAHLKTHPWLGEFYGAVPACVRDIYREYLGWFYGDPTFLDPLHPVARSQEYINLMGGRDILYSKAYDSFKQGNYQWCAELLTLIITVNINDMEARNLKAKALEHLGYSTINTNWRNWYLTSRDELNGSIDHNRIGKMEGVDSTDILNEIYLKNFMEGLSVRIDPSKSLTVNNNFIFHITTKENTDLSCSSSETYELEIRHGIVEIHDHIISPLSKGIVITDKDLRNLFTGRVKLEELFSSNKIRFLSNTSSEDVKHFFTYFDLENILPMNQTLPHLHLISQENI